MLLVQDSLEAEADTREQLDEFADTGEKAESTSLSSIPEEVRESEYEAFDKFDFDDKYLNNIGQVSRNKVIQATYASIVQLQNI